MGIQFAVRLEQLMMEGSYNQVIDAQATAKQETMGMLMDQLSKTVVEEIAESMEVAYSSLSIAAAQSILKKPSQSELVSYIQTMRPDWRVVNGTLDFPAAVAAQVEQQSGNMQAGEVSAASIASLPNLSSIKTMLNYSEMLEA